MSDAKTPQGATLHEERLLPGPGGWAALVGFAVVVGIALIPVDPLIGAVVAALVLLVLLVATTLGSPVVRVADGELKAGSAHIPVQLLGTPAVLDRAGITTALGPGSDARTHACLRAWIRGAVLIPVVDPEDPTPAWLVSSRRPTALATALGLARAQAQAAHSEQIG